MISISRSLARQFRAVARRAGLCKVGQPGSACVRLIATADTLRMQSTNGRVAVEHQTAGRFDPTDIAVPLQLFADCEAKNDGYVTIRRNDSSGIAASWADRGVPQHKEYSAANASEIPVLSQELMQNPPNLLVALRDAKATTEGSSTRYALDCVQLNGATGTIAATDTHQLLIQTGFQFPWQDQVLMHSTDVFASRELPAESPVEIGRTESGVTVRVGEWTIHHEVHKDGRFPNVEQIVPKPVAIKTRMQVDAADAKFLSDTLGRLPADDQTDRPLTLDLNGSVTVRARKDEQSPLMELLLSRSHRVGVQLRLQTNRAYLARALELGFTEVGFVNAESPCVCQDATRTYVWMLLENKGALEPSSEALQIDSLSVPSTSTTNPIRNGATVTTSVSAKATNVTPVNRVAGHLAPRNGAKTSVKARAVPASAVPQPTDVIEQALELRDQLRSVVQGLTELIGQIRQQRKQTRLMKSTLQSLKQLQLLEA